MTRRYWTRFTALLCALSLALMGIACGDDAATSPADDAAALATDTSVAAVDVTTPEGGDDVTVSDPPSDVSASDDTASQELDASFEGDLEQTEDATVEVEDALDDATQDSEEAADAEEEVALFALASDDFTDGGAMPEAFVCCQGSPSLSWSGVPEGTVSFALIYDDPDAGDFDHWALYNIPAEVTDLTAGASGKGITGELPEGATELNNGFGFPGYLGSCPPANHTYRWRLWALSGTVDTAPADFAALEVAANALSLGVAEMSQTFGPKTPEQGATCD